MEGYIVITPAMIEDLGLKGTELLCFAVIHGFSKDRQGVFTGSISYVSMMLGMAPRTIVYALKSLVEKGLVEKTELGIAGVQRVEYQISKEAMQKLQGSYAKIAQDLCKNCTPPSPLSPLSPSPTPLSSIPPISPNHRENTPSANAEGVYTHTRARDKGGMTILEEKVAYGEKVLMFRTEYARLVEKFGAAGAARLVEILDDYLVNHPRKRYESHYRAILSWCVDKYEAEQLRNQRMKNAQEAGERYGAKGTSGGAAALAKADEMAASAARMAAEEAYEEERALLDD